MIALMPLEDRPSKQTKPLAIIRGEKLYSALKNFCLTSS